MQLVLSVDKKPDTGFVYSFGKYCFKDMIRKHDSLKCKISNIRSERSVWTNDDSF